MMLSHVPPPHSQGNKLAGGNPAQCGTGQYKVTIAALKMRQETSFAREGSRNQSHLPMHPAGNRSRAKASQQLLRPMLQQHLALFGIGTAPPSMARRTLWPPTHNSLGKAHLMLTQHGGSIPLTLQHSSSSQKLPGASMGLCTHIHMQRHKLTEKQVCQVLTHGEPLNAPLTSAKPQSGDTAPSVIDGNEHSNSSLPSAHSWSFCTTPVFLQAVSQPFTNTDQHQPSPLGPICQD